MDKPRKSDVYYNYGRWVVDCPREYCNSAEKVDGGQQLERCTNCLQDIEITWPTDWVDIASVLDLRPVPNTRNWFPPDHRLAIASGAPSGQSVQDLVEESNAHGVKTRRNR